MSRFFFVIILLSVAVSSNRFSPGSARPFRTEFFQYVPGKGKSVTTETYVEYEPEKLKKQFPPKQVSQYPRRLERRKNHTTPQQTRSLIFDRSKARLARTNISPQQGEHPCFAGYISATSGAGRCGTFKRQYPAVGKTRNFTNPIDGGDVSFTFQAELGNFNIWGLHVDNAQIESTKKAVAYAENLNNDQALVPGGPYHAGGKSWLEAECLNLGVFPFDYTCSNKINILVLKCGYTNAFVDMFELDKNFPKPATNTSSNDYDIIFYLCTEMFATHSEIQIANTIIHELAHVIQAGYGEQDTVTTEGGATLVEGFVLGLPMRPMVYGWGFDDWNKLLAVNIYDQRRLQSARKFYQLWQIFLAYLSQPHVLGKKLTLDILKYRMFKIPIFGRELYDFFMQSDLASLLNNQTALANFVPNVLLQENQTNFLQHLRNFRVALVGRCLDTTPQDPAFDWPVTAHYWDCTSFPSFNGAHESTTGQRMSALGYGGSSVLRLMNVRDPSLGVEAPAGVAVSVIAERAGGVSWFVQHATPSTASSNSTTYLTLTGNFSNVFVVQTNVDPLGEFVGEQDFKVWQRTDVEGKPGAKKAWHNAKDGKEYKTNLKTGLRTALFRLPSNSSSSSATQFQLSFDIKFDIEPRAGSETVNNCTFTGYDGAQVRVLRDGLPPTTIESASLPYGKGVRIFLTNASMFECSNMKGWSGSSDGWKSVTFDLQRFAGETVQAELYFASDEADGGQGLWVDNVMLGSTLLDDADSVLSLTEKGYYNFSARGLQEDEFTEVPLLVERQDALIEDSSALKQDSTLNTLAQVNFSSGNSSHLRFVGPGLVSYFQPESDPESPAQAIVQPGYELETIFSVARGSRIREAIFFFQLAVNDIQWITMEIRQQGTVLGTAALRIPKYFMESIQRFSFDPPVELAGDGNFSMVLTVNSTKTDPVVAASARKQHLLFPLSYAGNHSAMNTWLHCTVPGKLNSTQNPFDGLSVPLRVVWEVPPGGSVPVTSSPTTRPPTNLPRPPTNLPTALPTSPSVSPTASVPGTTVSGASQIFWGGTSWVVAACVAGLFF